MAPLNTVSIANAALSSARSITQPTTVTAWDTYQAGMRDALNYAEFDVDFCWSVSEELALEYAAGYRDGLEMTQTW